MFRGNNMEPVANDNRVKPARGGRFSSVLGLAALAGALVLHVWFPHLDVGHINDTYNVDAGGRNALYQYAQRLEQRGELITERNHEPLVTLLDGYSTDTTLCLLGPARYPTPREWTTLLGWVHSGGKLVLAARWDDAELALPGIDAKVTSTGKKPGIDFFQVGESADDNPDQSSTKSGTGPQQTSGEARESKVAQTSAPAGPVWTSLLADANFDWKSEGQIEAPGAEVLVKTGATAQAVRLQHGRGTIVLLASDHIFSNAALYETRRRNG